MALYKYVPLHTSVECTCMQHTMSHPVRHIIYESYVTQQVVWARQAFRIKILAQAFASLPKL
jgi:hypothetical protein